MGVLRGIGAHPAEIVFDPEPGPVSKLHAKTLRIEASLNDGAAPVVVQSAGGLCFTCNFLCEFKINLVLIFSANNTKKNV